jgi:FKBP-type peptidyl-prolyl cis-trans isomerase SlyD
MEIADGSVVRLEYELKFKDNGEVIESSSSSGPVEYIQGQGKMLPALEKRLLGLKGGATLEGVIPAEEITPVESLPTKVISRSEFPPDAKIEVREIFEARTANGPIRLYITAVDDKKVTAKMLPPIAGRDIAFKVRIVMVEDPVTHKREVVVKKPPPVPLKSVDLEEDT